LQRWRCPERNENLKAIEQQWLDAYIKGDAAFIKGVEADDYTIVEPDGSVSTKADDVKAVTDKKFVLKTATMSDFKCRMLGDSHAVVTAAIKITGTDDGEDISGDYRAMDVFEKKDGKPKVVREEKCILCMRCVETSDGVTVAADDTQFIFDVESVSGLTAKEVLSTALEIMEERAKDFAEGVKKAK